MRTKYVRVGVARRIWAGLSIGLAIAVIAVTTLQGGTWFAWLLTLAFLVATWEHEATRGWLAGHRFHEQVQAGTLCPHGYRANDLCPVCGLGLRAI